MVVTAADPGEVVRAVGGLRAGRWWPELDTLLADIDRRVPDALQLGAPPTGLAV